jgi:hypothetical protein
MIHKRNVGRLGLVKALAAAACLAPALSFAGPPYLITAEVTFPGVPFTFTDLEVDAQGNAWVAGNLDGLDFPGVDSARVLNGGFGFRFVARFGPFDRTPAFVAVVGAPLAHPQPNAAGSFDIDGVMGLALDGAGNAYTVAYEASAERDYPIGGGAFPAPAPGDKFVYRISPSGAMTRVGDPLDAAIRRVAAVAVDGSGAIYLTGSAKDGLHTTAGAPFGTASVAAGCVSPYALKLDAQGHPQYATYLGYAGTNGHLCVPPNEAATPSVQPTGYAIAVDAQGGAVVAGQAEPGVVATPGAIDYGTKTPGLWPGNRLSMDPASHAFVTRHDP